MPIVSGSVVLVANTRSAEQLANTIYSYLPYPAEVTLYAATSAAPANFTYIIGDTTVADNQTLNYVAASITESSHLLDSSRVFAGTKLSLFFISTGTPTVVWMIRITPL